MSSLTRIQSILTTLLYSISHNNEVHYEDVRLLFEELEDIHVEYSYQLGYYWDIIEAQLYINKGCVSEIKQELLDMLYVVDDMIYIERRLL